MPQQFFCVPSQNTLNKFGYDVNKMSTNLPPF